MHNITLLNSSTSSYKLEEWTLYSLCKYPYVPRSTPIMYEPLCHIISLSMHTRCPLYHAVYIPMLRTHTLSPTPCSLHPRSTVQMIMGHGPLCSYVLHRMCVKSLVDKSAFESITDECPHLTNFCIVMEHILSHRLQGSYGGWCGDCMYLLAV